jgi:hypothetical protein
VNSEDHHMDLVRLARRILSQHRLRYAGMAGALSINDNAGTVSDRQTGALLGYVSPAYTAISIEELTAWWPWVAVSMTELDA